MSFLLKLRHWELFLMLVLFLWMYSVGAWCNRQLPESRRRSPLPFVAGLVVPIVYLLMYIFLHVPLLEDGPPAKPPLWMLPMHMLSLLGIFFGLWYAARQPKSLQQYEDADFMIFSSTFFLLFICPIGIWLIQPGVNELYSRLEQPGEKANEN
ncbi:MAG: hypothetical protein OER87_11760 [Gammaproteobacteria bacterium]|nr:hypothetical protein [Gammaproteobacteria bacterium]